MELLNKAKNEQLKRIKKLDARAQELLEKTKECESNINLLKDINNGWKNQENTETSSW